MMSQAGKILISVLVFGFVICVLAESVNEGRIRRRNGIAFPNYTISEKNENPDYELRHYQETTWLVIERESNCNKREAKDVIKYARGKNSENRNVSVGVPVLIKIIEGQGKKDLLFFMSEPNPPKPIDPKMSLVNFPEQEFYVIGIDGHHTKKRIKENKKKLINAVGANAIDSTFFYIACYTFPQRRKSHAEIWMKGRSSG